MDTLQTPQAGLVIAVVGFALLAIVVVSGLNPSHRDRRPALAAALATGAVIFLANLLAKTTGVWAWWGYSLSFIVQLGMLFAATSLFCLALLAGYRWVSTRTRRPLLAWGFLLIVLLVPLTVLGDRYALSRGTLSFGMGYNVGYDLLVGQVFGWLPVLFYLAFRGRQSRLAA